MLRAAVRQEVHSLHAANYRFVETRVFLKKNIYIIGENIALHISRSLDGTSKELMQLIFYRRRLPTG